MPLAPGPGQFFDVLVDRGDRRGRSRLCGLPNYPAAQSPQEEPFDWAESCLPTSRTTSPLNSPKLSGMVRVGCTMPQDLRREERK
jgi:hypothetical protein